MKKKHHSMILIVLGLLLPFLLRFFINPSRKIHLDTLNLFSMLLFMSSIIWGHALIGGILGLEQLLYHLRQKGVMKLCVWRLVGSILLLVISYVANLSGSFLWFMRDSYFIAATFSGYLLITAFHKESQKERSKPNLSPYPNWDSDR